MPPIKPLVLIADDDADERDQVARYLQADQYEVVQVSSAEDARRILLYRHVYLAFVDLYLDERNRSPMGMSLLREFSHVPFILMSGQNESRVQEALRQYEDRRLKIVSKDDELGNRKQVNDTLDRHASKHYNLEAAFEFRERHINWESVAGKLVHMLPEEDAATLGAEIEYLAKKAFCEWDASQDAAIRASHIIIQAVLYSGANSVVMWVRPTSATHETQADVIFKVAPFADDHSRFAEYKNIVGGYGLRERRYVRTVHFHGQVYVVPYFAYTDTKTYAQFFAESTGDEISLQKIENITRYLYERALRPVHTRRINPTVIKLSDYGRERTDVGKRLHAIRTDLAPENAPAPLRRLFQDDDLVLKGQRWPNPTQAVLIDQHYPGDDQEVETALRHGDMHAGNVLVDVDQAHLSCWFIDYESFRNDHYILVDHVEFEANLLFTLMEVNDDFDAHAQLIDLLTPLSGLADIPVETLQVLRTDPRNQAETRKIIAAIRPLRQSAQRMNGDDSPQAYYHALMYEALRVAGKHDAEPVQRRWFALIAAAQLFEKVQRLAGAD